MNLFQISLFLGFSISNQIIIKIIVLIILIKVIISNKSHKNIKIKVVNVIRNLPLNVVYVFQELMLLFHILLVVYACITMD